MNHQPTNKLLHVTFPFVSTFIQTFLLMLVTLAVIGILNPVTFTFFLLVSILVTFVLRLYFRCQLSEDGILASPFFSAQVWLTWQEIQHVRRSNFLGFSWMVISGEKKGNIRLPIYWRMKKDFSTHVAAYCPENHLLRKLHKTEFL